MLCGKREGEGGREERETEREKEREIRKANHIMSVELSNFKSHKEQEAALSPGCVHDHRLNPAVCRCEILEWQILDRGKRGFCDFLLDCFLRLVSLYANSPPPPVPWPPECAPTPHSRA